MAENNGLISNIIKYWDAELLCSLESSTSHADPDLAYLDNAIENQLLQKTLTSHIQEHDRSCLDVGAGYGRFAPTFQQFYTDIVLLEAAKRIYDQLHTLWQRNDKIHCRLGTFESFNDDRKFDMIFASGVLYLYNDEMLYQFLTKSRAMLAEKGLLILRDFISVPPRVTKSEYVESGFCHYRSPQFWANAAEAHNYDLVEDVRRSKPRLRLLRTPRIYRILRRLHLTGILRHPISIDIAMKLGGWRLYSPHEIQTVYLVMRAL